MHKEVMVMGRLVMQPRLVAYQADDPGLAYTYSRLTLAPDAWSPAVLAIKVRLCEESDQVVSSQVAMCYYSEFWSGLVSVNLHLPVTSDIGCWLCKLTAQS